MEISADKVVLIHYTLKDDAGAVIDSSAGGEPLAYIQGHGNLVSGLEKALEGKSDGSQVAVSVNPEEGYGKHEPGLIQRVPKRTLQGSGEVKKGMQFQARTADEHLFRHLAECIGAIQGTVQRELRLFAEFRETVQIDDQQPFFRPDQIKRSIVCRNVSTDRPP